MVWMCDTGANLVLGHELLLMVELIRVNGISPIEMSFKCSATLFRVSVILVLELPSCHLKHTPKAPRPEEWLSIVVPRL